MDCRRGSYFLRGKMCACLYLQRFSLRLAAASKVSKYLRAVASAGAALASLNSSHFAWPAFCTHTTFLRFWGMGDKQTSKTA